MNKEDQEVYKVNYVGCIRKILYNELKSLEISEQTFYY